ncbi:hypothetical protein JTE90_001484 [Oedothorax gibbosus]|uniref:Uncharacterized protein n=1 Tax=Oedothorax gibbosus TaxID=931172 RepID=A0AAV6TH14_9ARAC|nr:hypothetical protein JTE90_001484 [Oedothorax gibbosus]
MGQPRSLRDRENPSKGRDFCQNETLLVFVSLPPKGKGGLKNSPKPRDREMGPWGTQVGFNATKLGDARRGPGEELFFSFFKIFVSPGNRSPGEKGPFLVKARALRCPGAPLLGP